MESQELWKFLVPGYLFTIAIETPILLVGLSRRHPMGRRFFAALWLTACTYPIVVLVLPSIFDFNAGERPIYLWIAETFAPAAEVLLFWAAFGDREQGGWLRDAVAITLANLASFGLGELLF